MLIHNKFFTLDEKSRSKLRIVNFFIIRYVDDLQKCSPENCKIIVKKYFKNKFNIMSITISP